jgi:hypothetical protein
MVSQLSTGNNVPRSDMLVVRGGDAAPNKNRSYRLIFAILVYTQSGGIQPAFTAQRAELGRNMAAINGSERRMAVH